MNQGDLYNPLLSTSGKQPNPRHMLENTLYRLLLAPNEAKRLLIRVREQQCWRAFPDNLE